MRFTVVELTGEQKLFLDSLSPSEFDAFCQNYTGEVPRAVLDHYRETFLWWGSTIYHPTYGEVPYDAPDHLPDRERLAQVSERGTFIVEDEPPEPMKAYTWDSPGSKDWR